MLTAGFAEPVLAAQATFRVILDAMARPGRVMPMTEALSPPSPMNRGAAAIAYTLCDHDTIVWLDPVLRASSTVCDWLRFHCGCEITDTAHEAAFGFAGDMTLLPEFEQFNIGTADYPDRSTTLVLQVQSLAAGTELSLSGPGIRDCHTLRVAPTPHDLIPRLNANAALFPRGIDLLFVTDDAVAALPRSVRVGGER